MNVVVERIFKNFIVDRDTFWATIFCLLAIWNSYDNGWVTDITVAAPMIIAIIIVEARATRIHISNLLGKENT